MLSIKSYGAKGDGTADDFAAIQSALDSGEKEIYIPMGIYCVSGTLLVHSDTHIVADNGGKIVMKSKERRKRNEFLLSNADVVNGNKNISIAGGIWDGNNTQPENAKPDLFDKEGLIVLYKSFLHHKLRYCFLPLQFLPHKILTFL